MNKKILSLLVILVSNFCFANENDYCIDFREAITGSGIALGGAVANREIRQNNSLNILPQVIKSQINSYFKSVTAVVDLESDFNIYDIENKKFKNIRVNFKLPIDLIALSEIKDNFKKIAAIKEIYRVSVLQKIAKDLHMDPQLLTQKLDQGLMKQEINRNFRMSEVANFEVGADVPFKSLKLLARVRSLSELTSVLIMGINTELINEKVQAKIKALTAENENLKSRLKQFNLAKSTFRVGSFGLIAIGSYLIIDSFKNPDGKDCY